MSSDEFVVSDADVEICRYCGFRIENRDQPCPALENGPNGDRWYSVGEDHRAEECGQLPIPEVFDLEGGSA